MKKRSFGLLGKLEWERQREGRVRRRDKKDGEDGKREEEDGDEIMVAGHDAVWVARKQIQMEPPHTFTDTHRSENYFLTTVFALVVHSWLLPK